MRSLGARCLQYTSVQAALEIYEGHTLDTQREGQPWEDATGRVRIPKSQGVPGEPKDPMQPPR